MALFLDRHKAPGATAADIAAAHELDLAVQDKYQVRYVTYWFDDGEGTVFCLAEGPDRESLETVHREAHGLVADNIIEVGDGPINAFLGDIPRHPAGEAYVESPVRVILFTDLCDSTQQTQELGDEGYMLLLREHDELVRTALHKQGGREVKHTGDGIMASFLSVSAAVESGIDIQRSFVTGTKVPSGPSTSALASTSGSLLPSEETCSGPRFNCRHDFAEQRLPVESPSRPPCANSVSERALTSIPRAHSISKGSPSQCPFSRCAFPLNRCATWPDRH